MNYLNAFGCSPSAASGAFCVAHRASNVAANVSVAGYNVASRLIKDFGQVDHFGALRLNRKLKSLRWGGAALFGLSLLADPAIFNYLLRSSSPEFVHEKRARAIAGMSTNLVGFGVNVAVTRLLFSGVFRSFFSMMARPTTYGVAVFLTSMACGVMVDYLLCKSDFDGWMYSVVSSSNTAQ